MFLFCSFLEISKNDKIKLIPGIYKGIPNLLFNSAKVSIFESVWGQFRISIFKSSEVYDDKKQRKIRRRLRDIAIRIDRIEALRGSWIF